MKLLTELSYHKRECTTLLKELIWSMKNGPNHSLEWTNECEKKMMSLESGDNEGREFRSLPTPIQRMFVKHVVQDSYWMTRLWKHHWLTFPDWATDDSHLHDYEWPSTEWNHHANDYVKVKDHPDNQPIERRF